MSVQNGNTFRSAAFYDLDGTLVDVNLLHVTAYMLANVAEWKGRLANIATLAMKLPGLYAAERHDRRLLNVAMFGIFKGISRDRLAVLGEEYCERVLMQHFYSQAVDLLAGNRDAGLEPILVTGSPDFVVSALARRLGVATFAANRLAYSRNLATGRLREPIIAGEEKARWCEEYAARKGLRLRDCWGYADSYYDLPFLTALGHPVAVNPDRRLLATARDRQWPIIRFGRSRAAAPAWPDDGEP
ncbi:MAG TPA: HAD-IB family hydrolase [Candidatus Binataceae bacterium]|nr:HAD-IB family hydrolase [Candidatus Binataceae bacterium]